MDKPPHPSFYSLIEEKFFPELENDSPGVDPMRDSRRKFKIRPKWGDFF